MNLLELVAHDTNTFADEVKLILKQYPEINGINIPDILSLPIRSDVASKVLLKDNIFTLTHLRSQDRSIQGTLALVKELVDLGLTHLLIISGDKIEGEFADPDSGTVSDQVKALKATFPNLKVFCGLDPYRTSFKAELDYCDQKLKAGADGFFTQPFFDCDLARIYLDQLEHTTVFLGISPVLSQSNYNYWKTKNSVVFPKNFRIDFDLNCKIAKGLINLAADYQQHVYLMPILAPIKEYLRGIWQK
ncbi:MAG: methylenetetrahydrofolate reductase [Candidatus Margulisiibacteriota bacterium]|jgi:methylenetetrahydrofolate reductase (NADPH)